MSPPRGPTTTRGQTRSATRFATSDVGACTYCRTHFLPTQICHGLFRGVWRVCHTNGCVYRLPCPFLPAQICHGLSRGVWRVCHTDVGTCTYCHTHFCQHRSATVCLGACGACATLTCGCAHLFPCPFSPAQRRA